MLDHNNSNNSDNRQEQSPKQGTYVHSTFSFDELVRSQSSSDVGTAANVELFCNNGKELLKASSKNDIDLLKFDRGSFDFLAYSNIVLTKKVDNVIYYFVIQLAGTGIASQTPSSIMDFKLAKIDPYKKNEDAFIVIPGEAIEDNLKLEIERSITASIKMDVEYEYTGGLIVHGSEDLASVEVAAMAITEALNVVNNTIVVHNNHYSDTELYKALKNKDVRHLAFNTVTQSPSFLGDIRYTNFSTTLSLKDINSRRSINQGGSEITIVNTYGNVALSVFEESIVVTGPNYQPINTSTYKFFPTITVNAMDLKAPTTGSALLAIAQSAIMTQDKRWATVLADTVRPGKNPGVISLFSNEKLEGKSELVDLTNKAFSNEQRLEYIVNNVEDRPVLQMDIPGFAFGTSNMNIFAIAATTIREDNREAKEHDYQDARDDIINTCVEITGGRFPADYDTNKIFALEAISLPYGTFVDKDKAIKSIDEIDLMYMFDRKTTASTEMQQDFIATEVGAANDLVRVSVLRDLKLSTAITGSKKRVVFDPMFITTLLRAITEAQIGFSAEASRVVTQVSYGFDVTSGLHAAGLNQAGMMQNGAFQTSGVSTPTMGGQFFSHHNTY